MQTMTKPLKKRQPSAAGDNQVVKIVVPYCTVFLILNFIR